MNGLIKLTLLSATLALAGCNEKVAPELQDANASSSTIPTNAPQDEYYFSLTNASNPLLNYVVHQTGSGKYDKKCEVRKNIPLSNSLYRDGADPESDITCYFEAEELALYIAGLSMKIDASANTCQYVTYSPFSYYNRMAGDSSTDKNTEGILKFNCDAATVSSADILAAAGGPYDLLTDGTAISCGQYLDDSVTPRVQRRPFSVENNDKLCRYKYTDGDSENCDIGVIKVTNVNITEDSTSGVLSVTTSESEVKCGGKAYNCIRGPISLITGIKGTIVKEYTATTHNQTFTKTWELPGLINVQFPGTWEYANFRRDLASLNIDYGDSTNNDPTTYVPMFAGMKDFSADLIDRYSTNRKMDGDLLIDSTTYDKWSHIYHNKNPDTGFKQQRSKPLSAEPFLGIGAYRTNPFYTFYCLDGAQDIKARIRVVVRDWDRVYPSNSNLELISDINLLTNSRQDINNVQEIPDDGDPLNWYNDRGDWDDIISMYRTPGAFDPSTTTWRPTPTATNSLGFFNPLIFPSVMKDQ